MSIRNKIMGFITTASICAMLFPFNAFAAEKTWQEAYMDIIETAAKADSSDVDSSSYSLNYIDNDDIPELYMWDGKTYQSLYSYNNGAVLCKELSYRGTIWASGSGYFWTADSSNAAYKYYDFHKLEGGSCSTVYSFCIDRSDESVEKYLINDEEVDKEEYESKMAESEAECPLYSEYMINYMTNKTSYSYDEIRQYLLDSAEDADSMEIDEDNAEEQNTASFEMSSKTDAVVAEAVSKVGKNAKSPDTSDNGIAFAFIGASISAVVAAAFKKRKS
ncbi:MAG: hypothetical protein NC320_08420 [Clostridium sp.]|nr:hypothetical protein [Clostridium sp.]